MAAVLNYSPSLEAQVIGILILGGLCAFWISLAIARARLNPSRALKSDFETLTERNQR